MNIPEIPNTLGHSEVFQKKIKAGKEIDTLAVRYYVARKRPLAEVPTEDRIPTEMEGIPTDVVELGEVKAQPFHIISGINIQKVRPIQPGYSIGHWGITAGTLGAIVWKKGWPWEGLLSNNHVLANSVSAQNPGRANLWDAILQPGPMDGGELGADLVAWLYGWTSLVEGEGSANEVDRAWALLTRPMAYRIAPVRGPRQAEAGLEIVKNGRTTGFTEGQVYDVSATIIVDYGQFKARFVGQIISLPAMSQPGDSGSLATTREGKAVGLVFAGSPQATLLNPMGKALEGGLELVGISE